MSDWSPAELVPSATWSVATTWCSHRIVVDDDNWRRCLTCGMGYDRADFLAALRQVIRSRYRLPPSPWSQAERSDDPW